MLAKKADCILVSFEDAISRIKNAKKVIYTGTPVKIVKKDYNKEEKENMIKRIGLDLRKPIVLVFGGSQGAQAINETIIGIAEKSKNTNYQIMWATGPKQYDLMKEKFKSKNLDISNIKNMKIVPYIYNMEEIMNLVDIIVARSGAMTITEIANLGKPSILVPLPNVSGDHQLYNAKVLEKVGAAKIILNNEITDEKLDLCIKSIINNPQLIEKMGKNARKIEAKDVENKIYNEIKKLVPIGDVS